MSSGGKLIGFLIFLVTAAFLVAVVVVWVAFGAIPGLLAVLSYIVAWIALTVVAIRRGSGDE